MPSEKMEANLFELYSQNENRQTHAFLSLLKLIKTAHYQSFADLCVQLEIASKAELQSENTHVR